MAHTSANERRSDVRVAIVDGDKGWRTALAARLKRAECHVVTCPGPSSLLRALKAHRDRAPAGSLDLVVLGAATGSTAWLEAMSELGAFGAGAPVLVTLPALHAGLERRAYRLGAELVVSKANLGLDGAVHAVQRLVEGERRWQGAWISTALLQRDDGG